MQNWPLQDAIGAKFRSLGVPEPKNVTSSGGHLHPERGHI